MLRFQTTHDTDTLLYLFHIRGTSPDERRERPVRYAGRTRRIWLEVPSI